MQPNYIKKQHKIVFIIVRTYFCNIAIFHPQKSASAGISPSVSLLDMYQPINFSFSKDIFMEAQILIDTMGSSVLTKIRCPRTGAEVGSGEPNFGDDMINGLLFVLWWVI